MLVSTFTLTIFFNLFYLSDGILDVFSAATHRCKRQAPFFVWFAASLGLVFDGVKQEGYFVAE